MRYRSIPAGVMVAGLAIALAGPDGAPELRTPEPALADTLAADWLSQVTMEPIRVVIPRSESANPDSRESPRP
jgi:hypothetical protein